MRIKSLNDLTDLSMGAQQAAQLKKALSDYKRDSKRISTGGSASVLSQARMPGERGNVRDPQQILAAMIRADQHLSAWEWVDDFSCAIPGRKLEIDIAIPELRLGVEVDGWQYHGKYLKSFLRDRDKDYLLSLKGWLVVRIQAGLINSDAGEALERVRRFIEVWEPKQRQLLGV